jgi:hypothetical protein
MELSFEKMDNLMWALIFYSAHGSGTINESGLFGFWYWLAGVQDAFMLCRDILGSGIAFVAGPPQVGTFTINI